MRCRHLTVSLVRCLESCLFFKSILICSSHVLLGLLRLLLSSTIILSILFTRELYVFLRICPNHLYLSSRIFVERGATHNFSLNSWFLIISIIVCPPIHLNIRISVTFMLCSKTFFTGQHSVPYKKDGVIAMW